MTILVVVDISHKSSVKQPDGLQMAAVGVPFTHHVINVTGDSEKVTQVGSWILVDTGNSPPPPSAFTTEGTP